MSPTSTLAAPTREQESSAGPAPETLATPSTSMTPQRTPSRRRIFVRRRPPLTILDLLDYDGPAPARRRAGIT